MGNDSRVRFQNESVSPPQDPYRDDIESPAVDCHQGYGSIASVWDRKTVPQSMSVPRDVAETDDGAVYLGTRKRRCVPMKWICVGIIAAVVGFAMIAVGLTVKSLNENFLTGRPPSTNAIEDDSATFCKWSDAESSTLYYKWDNISDFALTESMYGRSRIPTKQIKGTINIVQVEEQESDVIVGLVLDTTDSNGLTGIHVTPKKQALSIVTQPYEFRTRRTCAQITATIFIKKGVELDSFDLWTGHLDLDVPWTESDARFANTSTFSLKSGNAHFQYYDSRKTRIELSSGAVSGRHALRDLLAITTFSGNIDVAVDPKEVDPDHYSAAELKVRSSSGTVTIDMPVRAAELPDRDYDVKVATTSGTVKGNFIMGSSAALSSFSGIIEATILPTWADKWASVLRTVDSSGRIAVQLLSPYFDAGKPIKRLRSTHSTVSGQLKVVYPTEWEGTIDASTLTGIVQIRGDGLRDGLVGQDGKEFQIEGQDESGFEDESVDGEGGSPGWRGTHLVVEKGNGTSLVEAHTQSGTMEIVVGDIV